MITRTILQSLLNAGAVQTASIVPTTTGTYLLIISTANSVQSALYTERKRIRQFKTIDAVYALMCGVGLTEAQIITRPVTLNIGS
jgi:hypothetical protein